MAAGFVTTATPEPCPPVLWPSTEREPHTQTIVVSVHRDTKGGSVRMTLLQIEPNGRVMEFDATLNRSQILREAGPSIPESHMPLFACGSDEASRTRCASRRSPE